MAINTFKPKRTVDSILSTFTKSLNDLKSLISEYNKDNEKDTQAAQRLFDLTASRQKEINRAERVVANITSLLGSPQSADVKSSNLSTDNDNPLEGIDNFVMVPGSIKSA